MAEHPPLNSLVQRYRLVDSNGKGLPDEYDELQSAIDAARAINDSSSWAWYVSVLPVIYPTPSHEVPEQ